MIDNTYAFLQNMLALVTTYATAFGFKLLGAIAVVIIGSLLIKLIMGAIVNSKGFAKTDASVQSFLKNFVKMGLNILLAISVAFILGIPTASFVALIASAGVAIGLALQGSLSNFAGGVVLLIFRQFKVGDCISVGGNTGVVKDISVFYTVLVTPDNSEITLPNGSLTNTSVTNYSAQGTRRVDIKVTVPAEANSDNVKKILLFAASQCDKVLSDPGASVANTARNATAADYTLMFWCDQADYGLALGCVSEKVMELFGKDGSGVEKYTLGTPGAI